VARDGKPDNIHANQLVLDLQDLLDVGLVEYKDEADPGVRHFKPTPLAARLTAEVRQRRRSRQIDGQLAFRSPAETPCAHCGAVEGFDEGARCRNCHVPQPPYM
jgi:hypothetical protein